MKLALDYYNSANLSVALGEDQAQLTFKHNKETYFNQKLRDS